MDEPGKKSKFAVRIAVAVLLLLAVATSVVFFRGTANALLEINARRIEVGMTQAQVESILGPPNPLGEVTRRTQPLWDAGTLLGYRYVSLTVNYDRNGRVESKQIRASWTHPVPEEQ